MGFTFIELLIALTIFAIIASSIYYTLNAGIRTYSRGNSIIKGNQKLRIFFDIISKDMRNAIPTLGEDPNFIITSEWEVSRISFPTIINVSDGSVISEKIAKVTYEFDGGKGQVLRSSATPKKKINEDLLDIEVLLEESEDFTLEDLAFEYYHKIEGFEDEYEWTDEWESEVEGDAPIPRGVKIILMLKNKTTESEETLEKIILIPMGILGKEQ